MSTDDDPNHTRCPSGEESWCFYKRAEGGDSFTCYTRQASAGFRCCSCHGAYLRANERPKSTQAHAERKDAKQQRVPELSDLEALYEDMANELDEGRMTFPEVTAPARTNVAFDELRDEEHHITVSPLKKLEIDWMREHVRVRLQ